MGMGVNEGFVLYTMSMNIYANQVITISTDNIEENT